MLTARKKWTITMYSLLFKYILGPHNAFAKKNLKNAVQTCKIEKCNSYLILIKESHVHWMSTTAKSFNFKLKIKKPPLVCSKEFIVVFQQSCGLRLINYITEKFVGIWLYEYSINSATLVVSCPFYCNIQYLIICLLVVV